jgi:hypothetical protein
MLKIVNCQNYQKTVLSQLEKVGGHRYPPGSILPPYEAMVSIALSSQGRGKSVCWICILVSCLYCWRNRVAQFVEVCQEIIEAEDVQQVEIHEGRFAEGIFSLFCSLFDLLLLDRMWLGRSCSGCSVLLCCRKICLRTSRSTSRA